MAFQNTTLSNIDNLNLGIPINQNVETDILSQDELNAIIMSQMGNNNPIQTIPVSPTIVQQEVHKKYNKLWLQLWLQLHNNQIM
jgi:hypothetical protein